jgi:hypothetical protein
VACPDRLLLLSMTMARMVMRRMSRTVTMPWSRQSSIATRFSF